MSRVFRDRSEAGRLLAARLAAMKLPRPVVLALPRGGVPVAAEVAKALAAPLDVLLVRKIGVPFQLELALGAVVDGENPQVIINEDVRRMSGVGDQEIELIMARELAEIERRRALYLKGRERVSVRGATAIVIDDGIATGATVRAALMALRREKPDLLVLAVPVAPGETLEMLRGEVDGLVCLETPCPFYAIGLHYEDFRQVSDGEVALLLRQGGGGARPGEGSSAGRVGPL